MAQVTNTFIAGKMNKSLDDRLIPKNQYKDGLNIRVDSSDASEAGRVENEKGNEQITSLGFSTTDNGFNALSSSAMCIGSVADGQEETIYFFVTDNNLVIDNVAYKYDCIVAYNTANDIAKYIIEDIERISTVGQTTLNFNTENLITGVDVIRDDESTYLYFTDDLNPPRYVDVDKDYVQPTRTAVYSSALTEDDISVIVKAPVSAPSITLSGQNLPENYMEDKFICFAYRWRYNNDQFSALSPFTQPAFSAGSFSFDPATLENEYMKNILNTATIEFETGSDDVKEIEVVFKEINKNNVYSIERVERTGSSAQTISFQNQKIFTTLDPNQLGRLYDNVPLKAKAQTTMGNRIIYGNYVEQYDLTDSNGNDINIPFTTELQNPFITDAVITGPTAASGSSYTFTTFVYNDNPANTITSYNYDDSVFTFDLGSNNLEIGNVITLTIDFDVTQFQWLETPLSPANGTLMHTEAGVPIVFTYQLTNNYSNAAELIADQDFIDAFGGNASVNKPLGSGATGDTLVDKFMGAIEGKVYRGDFSGLNFQDYPPVAAGITTNTNQSIITNVTGNVIKVQLPNQRYRNPDGGGAPGDPADYSLRIDIDFANSSASYKSSESDFSLKSDRDYELGIVYMDEYNRMSTVQVSESDATTFIPIDSAKNKNFIRAKIPTSMTSPSWASRYKFVLKESKGKYDTAFVKNAILSDATTSPIRETGFTYLQLEGNHVTKINEGDTIYVKGDRQSTGATFLNTKEEITKVVLSKEVLGAGDIVANSPAGVYIRVETGVLDFIGSAGPPDTRDFAITLETESADVTDFLYYESSISYPITSSGYYDDGNGNTNQSSDLTIDTDFANCITFYNGVESRTIFDRLTTNNILLGNRVFTTTESIYKQTRRTADLTYSGVFQGEIGINKLNEFNLSLANFKELEESFGPIQKLFARETDVLVLQEDKISYVLAGKNLLSDSVGGGSVTSIPEVLGTQIARTEDYGISFNPESFASYGYDRYFTDVKRGAVLQLRGGSAQSDKLTVISEFGMRSFFRDTLEPKLYKKVVGSYDQYSNEYVLSATDENIPSETFVIKCGSDITLDETKTFEVELGEDTGTVFVTARRLSNTGDESKLTGTWDGSDVIQITNMDGSFYTASFTKSTATPTKISFTFEPNDPGDIIVPYELFVSCPQ